MAIAKDKGSEGMIEVVNIVSGSTFQPLVQMRWGKMEGQLTVDEARQHALIILECAEAAESDAFVFHWLTRDVLETGDEKIKNWNHVIEEFKAFRDARAKKDE